MTKRDIKVYTILDLEGHAYANVWATRVEPQKSGNGGFWFYLHSEIVASAWDGYRDPETGANVFRANAGRG